MSAMSYKGYVAHVEYSAEDDCFVGHIAGINDIVGFHADSVAQLHRVFEKAVDDYLGSCKKAKKQPQKPYSGRIMLRIPPELHAKVAVMAEVHGKSLNSMVTELLDRAE